MVSQDALLQRALTAAGDAAACDAVHVAPRGFEAELRAELAARGVHVVAELDRLVFTRGATQPIAWAQNSWLETRALRIESIGDAARQLRAMQRNWHAHPVAHHRRAALIAERLPPIRYRALAFPCDPPSAPLGAWTLLSRDRLLASARCSSPFPGGEVNFLEDRHGPPSRAYLKLWEALTLARRRPGPGARCVDLGAAPGGWTWVLAELGAEVYSIDRAALAPELMRHPRIEHHRGDAFSLAPADVEHVDWVCCDLAAYPARTLELARTWAEAHPAAVLIFTIKLQGPPDPASWLAFLDIPGARVLHLWHNGHELTWFRVPRGGRPSIGLRGLNPGAYFGMVCADLFE